MAGDHISTGVVSSFFNQMSPFSFTFSAPPNHFPFLDLPPEIRCLIYDQIFEEATINLRVASTYVVPYTWTSLSYKLNCTLTLHRGDNFPNQILQLSKFVRQDAMPSLMRNFTLHVPKTRYARYAPVNLPLPLRWKMHLSKISYAWIPKLRINPSEYSGLRLITLEPKIYSFKEKDKPEREAVWKWTMDKIEQKEDYLFRKGVHGLKPGDGIEVRLDVWLINTRCKCTHGWAVSVDARN